MSETYGIEPTYTTSTTPKIATSTHAPSSHDSSNYLGKYECTSLTCSTTTSYSI